MRKINQYLPFILWSIATIILTFIAFLALPLLLLYKKVEGIICGHSLQNMPVYEESDNADDQKTNYGKSLIA